MITLSKRLQTTIIKTNNDIELFEIYINNEKETIFNSNSNSEKFLKDFEFVIEKLTKRHFKVFLKQQLSIARWNLKDCIRYSTLKSFIPFKQFTKSNNKYFANFKNNLESFKYIRKKLNKNVGEIDDIIKIEDVLKELNKLGYFQAKTITSIGLNQLDTLKFKNNKVILGSFLDK